MRKLLALSVVLTLAGAASAWSFTEDTGRCTVDVSCAPSPSDPNFETCTVTLTILNGDYIVGWDGTISGTINQQYPFGNPTLLMDNNNLFEYAPESLDLDSQYLFESNVKDPVHGVLIAGISEDSTSKLTAAFAMIGDRSNANAGATVAVAQVCVPVGTTWAEGNFDADVLVWDDTPDDPPESQTVKYTIHIPEPATLALLALGGLVMARRRR